jgi:phosphoribosylamine--glycine ligase
MIILVVGSGGREHALCWAIAKSPKCNKLFCAPGNAGILQVADCIDIEAEDLTGIVTFSKKENVDLVVIGPEGALVDGLADELIANGIKAFGPSKTAAHLEGSKGFMKDFFTKYNIPTAAYGRFTDHEKATAYVKKNGTPIVIKASGLAGGKGVILCNNDEQAIQALQDIMKDHVFGDAGKEVVIEEFLKGEEVSFFALVDGITVVPLASAQDHKAVHDGDKGPNTGGMGAYSPAPVVTDLLAKEIMVKIIEPTMKGMISEGRPYTGVLFAGLMITEDGPKVLEYNVRFGDPECQVLMARLNSDVVDAFDAVACGQLNNVKLSWLKQAALIVVMASKGYPGPFEKGTNIRNLSQVDAIDDVTVFHAGTKSLDNQLVANGGRVLGVTALGNTIQEAQSRAYKAVDKIDWPNGFCRRDIGWRAITREPN